MSEQLSAMTKTRIQIAGVGGLKAQLVGLGIMYVVLKWFQFGET